MKTEIVQVFLVKLGLNLDSSWIHLGFIKYFDSNLSLLLIWILC